MRDMAKRLGLDWNTTLFDAKTQDAMAVEIARVQGLGAWEGFKNHPDLREAARTGVASIATHGPTMDDIDDDPRFANVPLEDRLAIKADIERKVAAEETEAEKARKAEQEGLINALMLKLNDGEGGEADILTARNAGWLTDIEDIEKAQGILRRREEDLEGAQTIQTLIDNNMPYNPSVHGEAYNKWVGKQGLAQVGAMNQGYIDSVLAPAVTQFQEVPSDVVGALQGMARSTNSEAMMFAYSNLASLQDLAPQMRMPEELSLKLDAYRAMRGTAPAEDMISFLRGGRTPQEIQTSATLDREAAKIVASEDFDTEKIIRNYFDEQQGALRFAPTDRSWAAERVNMQREFTGLFKYFYRATGDQEMAKDFALKHMGGIWGVTNIGAERTIMRRPLEKVYPPIDQGISLSHPFGGTGYEAYEDQVRDDKDLSDDEEFQLVADDVTEREIAMGAEKLGRLPSYAWVKITADGNVVPMDPVTNRWYGEANAQP